VSVRILKQSTIFGQQKLPLPGEARKQILSKKQDLLLLQSEVAVRFEKIAGFLEIQRTGHDVPVQWTIVAVAGGQDFFRQYLEQGGIPDRRDRKTTLRPIETEPRTLASGDRAKSDLSCSQQILACTLRFRLMSPLGFGNMGNGLDAPQGRVT
jgi:hypothetical protein